MKKLVPICSVLGFVLGVVAIICCCAPGYVVTGTLFGSSSTTTYSVFNLMFGCNVTLNSDGDQVANAGLIIALVLGCVGALICLVELYLGLQKKRNKGLVSLLGLVAAACFVACGILFFCALKLTDLDTGKIDYAVIKGEAAAGAGVYLSAIFALLSGVVMIPTAIAPIFSKKRK